MVGVSPYHDVVVIEVDCYRVSQAIPTSSLLVRVSHDLTKRRRLSKASEHHAAQHSMLHILL